MSVENETPKVRPGHRIRRSDRDQAASNLKSRRLSSTIASRIRTVWKFLTFNEDDPQHRVWYNPKPEEFAVFITIPTLGGCVFGAIFMLENYVPYITPFGNAAVGAFIAFISLLEVCHIIWDRPNV